MNLGMVLREEGDPDGARSMLEAALRKSRRNGDNRGIASSCLFLACLASDEGDWHRAAMLHGAAQAILDRTSVPWDELETRATASTASTKRVPAWAMGNCNVPTPAA